MTPTPEVQERLRQYLLGRIDGDAREEIERNLLVNPELFEELQVIEDELIDDYVNGGLSAGDRAQFEKHFLSTNDRREQLSFGRTFHKYLKSESAAGPTGREEIKPATRQLWIGSLVSSPLRAVVFAIVIIGIGFGIWRLFFYQSEVDRGLLALNAAYRQQRPVESRISKFDYAPYVVNRGPGDEKIDQNELRRAELKLLDALKANPTPAVHHALGKVYLAKKQFEDAIKEFDEALQSDSKNSQLYNDLGAAWMEKGKVDLDKGKADPSSPGGGKGMEELGRALENLSQALKLNPNLLEALFNRALCHQYLMLSRQAAEDWREYLKYDSTSSWAEEARRNLKLLEEEKNKKSLSSAEMLQSFRDAYANRDDNAAWAALGPSRARTGNAIVQTLVDNYLSAAAAPSTGDKSELDLLEYAGKVEVRESGDQYTAQLSTIYRKASANQRANLMQARRFMKSGVDRYNLAELKDAIQFFSEAKRLFSTMGDEPEALFAEAWIGYSNLRTPDHDKSAGIFDRLSRTFEAKAYRSLYAQALFAQADAVGRNQFSKVIEQAAKALVASEQIEDNANAVRCLQSGTSMQLVLGNYPESLAATYRALSLAQSLPSDPKLIWPFYYEAALDFYFLNMPIVAFQFENEALQLALAGGLPLQTSRSYDRLAMLDEGQNNFVEARNNLEQARAAGQKVLDEKTRDNILAHSALTSARLYRKTGDLRRAAESIDLALQQYQKLNLDMYEYAAHKEKFLDLRALNDNAGAQAELDTTLSWFEKNQKEILEESFKNKFFDTGQNTYDLAIDFQISRNGDGWKAFDYAETARARSLLELATKGSLSNGDAANPELTIRADSSPLTLSEIQDRLPRRSQLLEYSVLDNKVVIWLVTSNRRDFAQAEISREELNEKIRQFVNSLRSNSGIADKISLGKELYAKLIAPIETKLDRTLELCIVPDDKLNFLPFGMLVSAGSGRYLLEDYALETSPSATIFITNCERASTKPSQGSEKVLVVGGPQFDREKFVSLEDLPSARHEAQEVAALYGAKPLLGPDATTPRVQRELQNADLAHFATHAVPDEQTPLLSKLLLSPDRGDEHRTHHAVPSFIQASEIYAMRLPRMRLVVLSACQTGIERAYRGEGAIGLARPFMVAGVPLVIASLWPVESQASADFMISFHKHRKQDHVCTVEALRRAQLEALHNSQSGAPTNYDWAAFVAIGGYASF